MATRTFISPLRALTARRGVLWAAIAGVATWLVLHFTENDFLPVARLLAAWNVGVIVYLTIVFWLLHDATADDMARHASQHRAGRHFVVAISLGALVVSLAVIAFEIRSINMTHDNLQGVRVAFVLVTVALSWLFIHTSFAMHYGFEYFGAREYGAGKRGGLQFPSGQDPDFWDIWNFSIVIGLCLATADINITSRGIRRITTVHGICSFLFNTVILAAAISFAGSFLNPGS